MVEIRGIRGWNGLTRLGSLRFYQYDENIEVPIFSLSRPLFHTFSSGLDTGSSWFSPTGSFSLGSMRLLGLVVVISFLSEVQDGAELPGRPSLNTQRPGRLQRVPRDGGAVVSIAVPRDDRNAVAGLLRASWAIGGGGGAGSFLLSVIFTHNEPRLLNSKRRGRSGTDGF